MRNHERPKLRTTSSPRRRALAAALTALLAVAGLALVGPAGSAGAASEHDIDIRGDQNSDLCCFGYPNTATYGQTITVPDGVGRISTFSFALDELAESLIVRGAVQAWDEGTGRATGPVLFLSDPISNPGGGATEISFAPELMVAPGHYVVYGTISHDYEANATATGVAVWGRVSPGTYPGGSSVFLNNGGNLDALTSSTWDSFGGDKAFTVTFDANEAPVADAGPDQTVTLGPGGTASVTFDGSGSSDPDGDVLTYAWTGGFEGGTADGVSPTVTFTAEGTYTVILTVDDGLATDTDAVAITVEEAAEIPRTYPPSGCSDVPRGTFYTVPFDWAWDTGVATGVGGTDRCEPLRDVTRAEAVTILWRSVGSPAVATPHPFTDTAAGAYYQPALRWAAANGHTTGIGGSDGSPSTTFDPAGITDRAQQFTFAWRVADRPSGPENPFVDVPVGSYYRPAVNWAADTGVTTGFGGSNRFEPHFTVDRAQAFTIAFRMFG